MNIGGVVSYEDSLGSIHPLQWLLFGPQVLWMVYWIDAAAAAVVGSVPEGI